MTFLHMLAGDPVHPRKTAVGRSGQLLLSILVPTTPYPAVARFDLVVFIKSKRDTV